MRRGFRFGISFYLIAMLFILFDVEVIFLYPVAVHLKAEGAFVLGEIGVFVALLARRLRVRVAQRSAGMEVKRNKAPSQARVASAEGPDGDFRIRQLRARDLLRGDLSGADLDAHVEQSVLTTTFDRALNWARSNALWPATFGLACCAIEMMSIVTARYDSARFGAEVFRASPRQADMLILSGRVSIKMAPVLRRIYDQMLEPKWVIAMGACASSAGRLQQLRAGRGGRQVPAGGRPRAGLPAAARSR